MNAKMVSVGIAVCVLLAGAIRPASARVGKVPVAPPVAESDDSLNSEPIEKNHPYSAIISRNVFHLVPIPPPAPQQAQEDPAASATIKLTGFMKSTGQPTRALFVNVPKNATNTIYYNLSAGERDGALELLKINEAEESVEVVHAGIRQTVMLKDSKPTGGPAGTAQPGTQRGAPGVVQPPPTPPVAQQPPPAQPQYTGGVLVSGGTAVPTVAQAGAQPSNAAPARSFIPTRTTRAAVPPVPPPQPAANEPAGAATPPQVVLPQLDAAQSEADLQPVDQTPDASATPRKFRR